MVGKRYKVPVF